jgi:hypothetical protein
MCVCETLRQCLVEAFFLFNKSLTEYKITSQSVIQYDTTKVLC